MSKLVVMLRVKDGMRFIERWLDHISPLVDEIVALDNGSRDGTLEVLRRHPKVVSVVQTEGFHEGRDKVLLLQSARERKAEWILFLDVDEFFEAACSRAMLEKMMASRVFGYYGFRRFELHRDENHFEASPGKLWITCRFMRVMWQDHPRVYYTGDMIHGAPQGLKGPGCPSHLRIRHYGALDRENLVKKTETYIAVDPANAPLYLKHRDQRVGVWPWHERRNRPLLVNSQLLVLDVLMVIRFGWSLIKRGRKALNLGGRRGLPHGRLEQL